MSTPDLSRLYIGYRLWQALQESFECHLFNLVNHNNLFCIRWKLHGISNHRMNTESTKYTAPIPPHTSQLELVYPTPKLNGDVHNLKTVKFHNSSALVSCINMS